MFATIATGGKQLKVETGRYYHVDLLTHDVGEEVVFDEVTLIHDDKETLVGQPFVEGAKVVAEVLRHEKDDKVTIIKFRRRKHSMTKTGFRAIKTVVLIKDIKKKAKRAAKKAVEE